MWPIYIFLIQNFQPEFGDVDEGYYDKSNADDTVLNSALNKMISGKIAWKKKRFFILNL